jgi:hypothetical protein
MKNLLIVNLDQDADILVSASFIQHYKNEGNTISFLTLASQASTVNSIQGLTNVYLVQLEEILKYKKHRIFSDLEMIRELANNMAPVQKIEWDEIINLSNSESAAYLVNCLSSKSKRGNRFTEQRTIFSDSDMGAWKGNKSLMSERSRLQELTGITPASLGALTGLGISEKSRSETVNIGIEINQASAENHLNQTTLKELIQGLTTFGYKAKVLLTNDKNLEKFVYELNEKLANTLEVVELNSKDITSQLHEFDLILSTTLNTKTTAEILGIKCLSLWTNLETLYRHRSGVGSYNLCVYPEKLALLRGDILSNTIISCVANNHQELMRLPEGVELYLSKEEDVLLPMSLHYNQGYFLRSLTEKALWREVHFQTWNDLKKYLKMIPDKELSQFIGKEKDALAVVAKSTLSAIRYLKNHTQGPNQVKELVNTLDLLINNRVDGATYFLLNLFKHRMDHLGATSKDDNILKTEKSLITLKNQLGSLTKILGDMAETINERRKIPYTKNYPTV